MTIASHRRFIAALAVLALQANALPAYAETGSPGQPPLVALPCGQIDPAVNTCLQAAITAPVPGETIDTGVTKEYVFKGVAERDSHVFVYFIAVDPTTHVERVINADMASETDADDHGTWRLTPPMQMATFPSGSYKVTSYFRASIVDHPADATFFQITGIPIVAFTVHVPPPKPTVTPPTKDPPRDSRDPPQPRTGIPGCIPLTELESSGGDMLAFDPTQLTSTIWHLHPTGAAGGDNGEMCRNILRAVLTELKARACGTYRFRFQPPVASDDIPSLQGKVVIATLAGEGFGSEDQPSPQRAQVEEPFRTLMGNGCGATERSFGPWAGVGAMANVLVYTPSAGIFGTLADANAQADRYRTADCHFTIDYCTGQSPLIFLSSEIEIDTQIDVRPAQGYVNYSLPAKPAQGWNVHLSPLSSAMPLYYEFMATRIPATETGWSVPSNQLEDFLRSQLRAWGYADVEIEAFLAKDVHPSLPHSAYISIHLTERSQIDQLLPLTITPRPDHISRVLFQLRPTASRETLSAPKVADFKLGPQSGFAVREIGAVIGG